MNAREMMAVPADGTEQQLAETMALLQLAKAPALQECVDQMGQYLAQMGKMMSAMQRRLDDLEAQQARVTVSHEDVKRIQALIRWRADEIGRKYQLEDAKSRTIFRAAIKKDILKRYRVKDLHDLPEAAARGTESLVENWNSIRLVMERRGEV